jgi:uncharacterized Zn finger protein (UPF0148 family)
MPFGEYKDMKDCMNKNKDKDNPGAYCASIHKSITGKWPTEKESFRSTWDSCTDRERRGLLKAAGLNDTLSGVDWKDLSSDERDKISDVMAAGFEFDERFKEFTVEQEDEYGNIDKVKIESLKEQDTTKCPNCGKPVVDYKWKLQCPSCGWEKQLEERKTTVGMEQLDEVDKRVKQLVDKGEDYGDIVYQIEKEFDMTTSDAQGVVDAALKKIGVKMESYKEQAGIEREIIREIRQQALEGNTAKGIADSLLDTPQYKKWLNENVGDDSLIERWVDSLLRPGLEKKEQAGFEGCVANLVQAGVSEKDARERCKDIFKGKEEIVFESGTAQSDEGIDRGQV